MLIDLVQELSPVKFSHIVQVGAHEGQEYTEHVKLGGRHFLYIEPQTSVFAKLKANVGDKPGVTLVNCGIAETPGKMRMYQETANGGQSSSFLKPKIHLQQYPGIVFHDGEEVEVQRLETVYRGWREQHPVWGGSDCTLLSVDVQGYELAVFRSLTWKQLANFDVILCEVNRNEVYEGCPMVTDIDSYLADHGFFRAKTNWAGGTWGDAIYVKSPMSKTNLLRGLSK